MAHDASIVCIFGMRGSGKSTEAVAQIKQKGLPTVVIDPTGNWADDLGVEPTETLAGVASKLKQYWRSNFRIVYVPESGMEAEGLHKISGMLKALQAGYKGKKHQRQIHLVVEEANLSYPSSGLPKDQQGFTFAIFQGRHWGINITAITQRPAGIHPNLRGNAQETFCLALADDRSISAVLEQCGSRYKKDLQNIDRFEYLKISGREVTTGKVRKPR